MTHSGASTQSLPFPQTREHLAKAQRGLPGEGVSEVIQTLLEISQDGTSYSGDLLSTIDVLRNMTEIFRRAYYSPTPGDVQVALKGQLQLGTLGELSKEPTQSPGRNEVFNAECGLGCDHTIVMSLKHGHTLNPGLVIG